MSQAGEIITLQVGNYANFVGAHFFNLQDPLSHPDNEENFNCHAFWMETRNAQRQRIVTPRLLMFDLKDNWSDKFIQNSGGLPNPLMGGGNQRPNALDTVEKGLAWDGKVQKVLLGGNTTDSEEDSEESLSESTGSKGGGVKRSVGRKSKKVKLGPYDFNHWGDYTKWRLHSMDKFAFRIPNFMYNAESDELISYGQGLDVYRKLEESVEDGIRLYAEDCDHLEGFHMLVDEYDGFTGISGGILEHLADEYDKKACLGLGLNRPLPEDNDKSQGASMKDYRIRISNTVQLWSAFNRHARVFSSFGVCEDTFNLAPVTRKFPGIIQDLNLPSVSSTILASTLDTLTAPYRLHSPSFPLHEMTSLLNAFGHKMTLIGSSLPFPYNQRTLFAALNEDGFSPLMSLTPSVELDLEKSFGNVFVVRGFTQDQVMSKSESHEFKHININSVTSCSELYCHESYPNSVHVIKDISSPFKLTHPFPNLYDASYLDSHNREKRFDFVTKGDSWLLPAIASAHNTPSVSSLLERIVSITGGGVGGTAMKMKMFYEPSSATCNSAAIEFEDYADSINELCTLRDSYSNK